MELINHFFLEGELIGFCLGIFKSVGVPSEIAEQVTKSLVSTSLVGIDSHGVILLPRYVEEIKERLIIPDAEPEIVVDKGVLSLISGNRGFGQITATFGLETAIEKAVQYGIGIIGLQETNHIGRVGEYVLKAADRGFLGWAVCNAGPNVAPYGARTRLFGTNPIACAVPTKTGKPILIDLATSIYPEGKVKALNNRGEALPQGIIIDKNGNPSSITQDLYDGGALLPIGEHKGSALSFMVEVLGGILTGAGSPTFSDWQGGNGVLFIVIDPTIFRSQDDFFKDIEGIKKSVKSQPCAVGVDEILLPGEPEYRCEAERKKNGIPIDDGTWGKICDIAEKYGLDIPEPIKIIESN